MFHDLVITGLGRVGPHGLGRAGLKRALREGLPLPTQRCLASEDAPISSPAIPDFVGRVAGKETHESQVAVLEDPLTRAETLVREAARAARREAGLDGEELRGELWIASSLWSPQRRLQRAAERDPELWTRWLTIAGAERLGGTVSAREASGLIALSEAGKAIEEGRTDRAIVIEVDSITPRILRAHRRLRALAPGVGDLPPIARPFDRLRRGAVLSEGATAVILERASEATARDARIRSRVRTHFIQHDESATPYGYGTDPRALGFTLAASLHREGIDPRTIEGIVCGARGSVPADAQEAGWIQGLYGDQPHPPVFAPIGTTGLGGGGLLAAACLAAEGAPIGGSAGFAERDPNLPIRPHPSAVSPTPGRILVSTIATGGTGAWLVLDPR